MIRQNMKRLRLIAGLVCVAWFFCGCGQSHDTAARELLKTAEIIPMVNQIELQPGLNRNIDCEYNAKLGIQLEAWAPFRIGESLNDPTVCKIAEKHSKTSAQIVLRWFLQKGIIPLPKSVTPERILSNIQVYDFELSDEDMTAINGIEQHPMRHDPDKIDF